MDFISIRSKLCIKYRMNIQAFLQGCDPVVEWDAVLGIRSPAGRGNMCCLYCHKLLKDVSGYISFVTFDISTSDLFFFFSFFFGVIKFCP